jgi:3-deoxy-D-manno-octulosonic-acid transferase
METELWPNFLRECRRRKIATAIVNGRLSAKSFTRYKRIRKFISKVVNCLDVAVMQTEPDGQRMRALGLETKRVMVAGNMKFDSGSLDSLSSLTTQLGERFNLSCDQPVLLAASTHDPEEQVVLDAFAGLRRSGLNNLRLVIAPRHPERFATVAALLRESEFSWARRSEVVTVEDKQADVILLDSIGELRALFPLASLVFVGGSLAPVGGHNVLEPAAAGACIITGPHTENFDEIVKTFKARDALVQIGAQQNGIMSRTLSETFGELLQNPQRRQALGACGKSLVEENRGATSRTIEILRSILTNRSRAGATADSL